MKQFRTRTGFSLIETLIAVSLLSGGSLLLMNYIQNQEKSIKKQSGDVSINYLLHNVSKVISARSVCTHSYKESDPKMILKENFQLKKIAIPPATPAQQELVVAKIEDEKTADKTGKMGFWISSMTISDFEPALLVPAPAGLRKAKLWMNFNRRISHDSVKTEKNFLEIFLVEGPGGKLLNCYGDEDFNAKAFCENSLRGKFEADTLLCKGIDISALESGTGVNGEGVYAMRASRDPANPTFKAYLRAEGGVKISEWKDAAGETKSITVEDGDVTNVRTLLADESIQAGEVTARRFSHTSDRRLKKNITPLTNEEVKRLNQITGVGFRWKDSDEKSLGFIAQDVEKSYPELVSQNARTGYKSVNYSGLVPILLEKLKTQDKEIQELHDRIERLEKKRKKTH